MLKKSLLLSIALGLASIGLPAIANAELYVTGSLGYGNTHYGTGDVNINSANINNSGFAWRLGAGYQFTSMLATEVGYLRFNNVNINTINGTANSTNISESAVDIVGKLILPLSGFFNVYGKLGVAYLMANADNGSVLGKTPSNTWGPTFGLGATFNFIPKLPLDISWNRIQTSSLPATDFYSVGLSFHFG